MKIQVKPEDVARHLFETFKFDKSIREEQENVINFVTGSINLEQYKNIENELEKSFMLDYEEFEWDELKKVSSEICAHEKAHYDVWAKYKLPAKLYRTKNHKNSYFVLERSSFEDLLAKHIDSKKYIQIDIESTESPFKNNTEVNVTNCIDVLHLEILKKCIRKLELPIVENAFEKYNWYRVDVNSRFDN